ncbi:hypothetical protein NBRC116592_14260 [Colwellia sp. KU-HH00111]|uniref:STAS/SEC14 domain-containing protein n=1 Tax=Colwellia sp. KU-HH00111 TaxID=3127652 RepID=UPI003106CB07
MKTNHHSLTISIKQNEGCYFLACKAIGKLSVEDYLMVTPIITSTFQAQQSPRFKILIDITQFEGWTLGAAWKDFMMGVKHSDKVDRIAIFGSHYWQKVLSNTGNWLVAGDIRYFETRMAAINWIENRNDDSAL